MSTPAPPLPFPLLVTHVCETAAFSQNTMRKSLKSLENRHLVKTVKSVTSKSRNLYMLYELSECRQRARVFWGAFFRGGH